MRAPPLFEQGVGGHFDVLGAIPQACKAEIVARAVVRKLKKGSVVWCQGDIANHVGFLIEGAAMSTFHTPTGRMGVTGVWFPGDILGAADLGGSHPRQITLKCIKESRIYELPSSVFFEIVARFPQVSEAVIRALSIRLRWVAHLAIALETQSAFGCVCTILHVLSERFSVPDAEGALLDLSLTNEDLASFVGVTRQRMNVTLRDLQRLGVIKVSRRKITLIDRARLQALIYNR